MVDITCAMNGLMGGSFSDSFDAPKAFACVFTCLSHANSPYDNITKMITTREMNHHDCHHGEATLNFKHN